MNYFGTKDHGKPSTLQLRESIYKLIRSKEN
jgi:hypothetical protein